MTKVSALLTSLLCLSSPIAWAQGAPKYEVDPFWPKELPNNWVLGQVRGVATDSKDHVWVLNDGVPSDNSAAAKSPPEAECCVPAPSVIEFDAAGSVVRSWGKPGFVPSWPKAPRGIHVDGKGNIWIAGVASQWNGEPGSSNPTKKEAWDRQVLKFSGDGRLLLQIGQPANASPDSQDAMLPGPTGAMYVDDGAEEIYIADGFVNRRVMVYDSNTGAFKRGWGAYGIPLSKVDNSAPSVFPTTRDPSAPPSKQFGGLTAIKVSKDGNVYVADQMNDRIQVFTRQGNFVKEFPVAQAVLGFEATWSMALSRDARQLYLFVTDGESGIIRIFDRGNGAELGKLGHKGRYAGQFSNLGWVAMDSKGAIYTGEVHFTRSWDGKTATLTGKPQTPGGRIQRFIPKK